MKIYGWSTEDAARAHVTVYRERYQDLLADPRIEGVIIALPLHLHARVAIEAMLAGKHVLTEKLMAHSVHECKEMARISQLPEVDKLLATGHQRHYSILYDNATDDIRGGLIGQVHHIRAQWHREKDTWLAPLPETVKKDLADFRKKLADAESKNDLKRVEDLTKKVRGYEARALDFDNAEGVLVDDTYAEKYGYQKNEVLGPDDKPVYTCTPLEELFRWRLWNRTGGGLMAELGSHQLDASSIFISAEFARAGVGQGLKVEPLSVTGVGGRHLYEPNRDAEDHVYCSFEFPGAGYYQDYEKREVGDDNKRIVVTYSSINGNGYGGYGEVVMGDAGTLILEREQEVLLFKGSDTATSVTVEKSKGLVPTSESGGPDVAVGQAGIAAAGAPPSRGYKEEIEHWAWCIRNRSPENQPRCHPKVAMADAVIALTSNLAMRDRKRIEFNPDWFKIESDETPEGVKPNVERWLKPPTVTA
jgi:predicted dehydrogenase